MTQRVSLAPGPSGLQARGAIVPVTVINGQDGTQRIVNALIDTGAFEFSLKAEIADSLGLPVTGHEQVGGANESVDVDIRRATLEIPDLGWKTDQDIVCLALPGDVDALVGRDVLKTFSMTWSGPNGTVVLEHTKEK